VAKRRQDVAAALIAETPRAEIAKRQGVHTSTISRDIEAILKHWHDAAARDYADHVARELAILTVLDTQNAEAVERLLSAAYAGESLNLDAMHEALGWQAERRQLRARVAALLGLNKQSRRIELTGASDGVPVEVRWRELPDDTESKREAARVLAASGVLAYDERDEVDDAVPVE
jgi:hypothetical protein